MGVGGTAHAGVASRVSLRKISTQNEYSFAQKRREVWRLRLQDRWQTVCLGIDDVSDAVRLNKGVFLAVTGGTGASLLGEPTKVTATQMYVSPDWTVSQVPFGFASLVSEVRRNWGA